MSKETETKELFQWVKASERDPEDAGTYHVNLCVVGADDLFPAAIMFTLGMWEVDNESYEVIEWLAPLLSSTEEVSDTISIDALLSEFKRYGIDTTNFDGDEGAESAIALGVKNLLAEQSWKPAQEVKTAAKSKDECLLEQGIEFDRIGYSLSLVEENALFAAMESYAHQQRSHELTLRGEGEKNTSQQGEQC